MEKFEQMGRLQEEVFSTPAGARLLALWVECFIFRDNKAGDLHVEGQRSFVLDIHHSVNSKGE